MFKSDNILDIKFQNVPEKILRVGVWIIAFNISNFVYVGNSQAHAVYFWRDKETFKQKKCVLIKSFKENGKL